MLTNKEVIAAAAANLNSQQTNKASMMTQVSNAATNIKTPLGLLKIHKQKSSDTIEVKNYK